MEGDHCSVYCTIPVGGWVEGDLCSVYCTIPVGAWEVIMECLLYSPSGWVMIMGCLLYSDLLMRSC